MLRCMKYELLKIFSRRLIPLLWAGSLLISGLLFCYTQRNSQADYFQNREAARELETRYAAMPEEEALEELNTIRSYQDALALLSTLQPQQDPEAIRAWVASIYAENPGLDDFLQIWDLEEISALLPLYSGLQQRYAWETEYPAYLDYVQEQAEIMQKVNIFGGKDSFPGRSAAKTAVDFQKCRGVSVAVGNDRFLEAVNSFKAADLMAALLLLAVTSILFLEEQENGQTRLIRSTPKGRITMAWAKLAVGVLLAAACALMLYGEIFLLSGILYGPPDWGRMVQSIRSFRECCVPLTEGQYALLFLAQKAGALALLTLVFAFLMQLLRSSKLAYLAVALGGVAEYLCYRFLHPASILNPLKFLNIFYILDPARLYTVYANLNLFGRPVDLFASIPIFCAASAVTLTTGFGLLTRYPPQWVWGGLSIRRNPHPERGNTRLLLQEAWRSLFTGKGILVWLLAILMAASWCRQLPLVSMSYKEAVYKRYITRFAGEVTPEKALEIEAVNTDFKNISQEFSRLQSAYEAGEISKEAYEKEMESQQFFQAQQQDFFLFYHQYQRVSFLSSRGITPVLLDKSSTDYLFDSGQRDSVTFVVMAVLLMLAVLPMGSGGESMLRLVHSTPKGRAALSARRMVLAAVFSVLMAAGRWGPTLWDLRRQYPITFWDAPIQNLEPYMALDISMTVGGLLALWIALQLAAAAVYGEWFLVFTQLSQRPTVNVLSGMLLLAATFGCLTSLPGLFFLNPAAAFSPLSPQMLAVWPVCLLLLLAEAAGACLTGMVICKK